MAAVRLVAARGGGGELQAAGSHAEGLSLFCDVQQLYLPAGQDEVTIKQLRGPSSPFPAAPLTFPPVLQLRGLQDIWCGVSERRPAASAPAKAHPPP